MVKRNIIPRRLIGAHHVRLLDFQGISYPASVLKETPPVNIADEAPDWGIPTNEVAVLLGCNASSARSVMDKLDVRKIMVRRRRLPPTWYWDKNQVAAIASSRHEMLTEIPSDYMTSIEVCDFLRISRSSLNRYVAHGLIEPHPVIFCSVGHSCVKHLFLRAEIARFYQHLNAVRIKKRRC